MPMDNQEWRWEGGIWSFIEIVQWALVFHKLGKEGKSDFAETMSSPEKVMQKADEYGMSMRAITKEMLRIGEDAESMFWAIDETKHREKELEQQVDEG